MQFIDDLVGDPLHLVSDLPPGKVAARLDAAIDSAWDPFAAGITGWVAFGRFALGYRRFAWLRRRYGPVLSGRVRPHGNGSRITVRYGPPRHLLLVYAIIAVYVPVLILRAAPGSAGMIVTFFFLAAIFLFISTIGADGLNDARETDLAELLAVVEAAADRVD